MQAVYLTAAVCDDLAAATLVVEIRRNPGHANAAIKQRRIADLPPTGLLSSRQHYV
jgi:hypothetical protein